MKQIERVQVENDVDDMFFQFKIYIESLQRGKTVSARSFTEQVLMITERYFNEENKNLKQALDIAVEKFSNLTKWNSGELKMIADYAKETLNKIKELTGDKE